jgi:MYXO-CTERM domain-containing protein
MFFGTRLAGKTFQLRFRIGTDSTIGSSGWQIDDVELKGIVGTPFPALVADTTACSALAGSDPGGSGGGGGALGGTGGANPSGGAPAPGTVAQAGDEAGCQVGGGAGLGGFLLGAAVLLRRRRVDQ